MFTKQMYGKIKNQMCCNAILGYRSSDITLLYSKTTKMSCNFTKSYN